MKLQNPIFLIIFYTFCLFSCTKHKIEKVESKKDSIWNARVERITYYKSKVDSLNKILNWKKTDYNLWKSKDGDLSIKTHEGNEQGIAIEKYITRLCCDGEEIKNVIDTSSFKYLGSSFYKDKRYIYLHYKTSDGGNFRIINGADIKTFQVIGNSCYAKDKNHIYNERDMKMDNIDYKTFKTCDDCGCYSKDKNGYYFWDQKIEISDIEKAVFEKLNEI